MVNLDSETKEAGTTYCTDYFKKGLLQYNYSLVINAHFLVRENLGKRYSNDSWGDSNLYILQVSLRVAGPSAVTAVTRRTGRFAMQHEQSGPGSHALLYHLFVINCND